MAQVAHVTVIWCVGDAAHFGDSDGVVVIVEMLVKSNTSFYALAPHMSE